MPLSGPAVPPRKGQTRQLVVLLHGWGANGNDLIGLAGPLQTTLPQARISSPDAPDRCDQNPAGRQWYSLMERRPERAREGNRPGQRHDQHLGRFGTRASRSRRPGACLSGIQPGLHDGAPRGVASTTTGRCRGGIFRHADRGRESGSGDRQPTAGLPVSRRCRRGRSLRHAAQRSRHARRA